MTRDEMIAHLALHGWQPGSDETCEFDNQRIPLRFLFNAPHTVWEVLEGGGRTGKVDSDIWNAFPVWGASPKVCDWDVIPNGLLRKMYAEIEQERLKCLP